MAEPLGSIPPLAGLSGAAAPSPPTIELAQPPPAALLAASTLAGLVLGRDGNGALLLRTDQGTLALKTSLAPPVGSRVDLRLVPGPPAAVMLLHIEEPAAPAASGGKSAATAGGAAPSDDMPPTQLDLGTEMEATVLSPAATGDAAALPAGTRLLLRLSLVPAQDGGLPPQAAGETRFTGTVAAGTLAGDQTLVTTPLGTLALAQRLALPPGATLGFLQLAVLPPEAAATPSSGTVLSATLLSPLPGDPQALPAGTSLLLRVAASTMSAAAEGTTSFGGTVLAGGRSETMLATPIGVIALDRRLALPPGTPLGLEQLAATPPDTPAQVPLAQGNSWPALDQSLAALARVAPDLAAQLRSDLTPMSGEGLAGTLLFLMGALTSGTWPGARVTSALDRAGRGDLRLRLDGDMAELRRLADPPSGDWRVYVLPLLDGTALRAVRLYLPRQSGGNARAEDGTRFVLDVDMSRLGELQLDGLVRQKRFDLVLRSHRAIAADMRGNIAAVFHKAIAAAGLAGDIVFTTASHFAVAPLAALHAPVGIDA